MSTSTHTAVTATRTSTRRTELVPPALHVPFSVIALEALLSLAGMGGLRVVARLADERRERQTRVAPSFTRRALLVGAGRTGVLAVRELQARPDMGYEVVGLVDDDPGKHGQKIQGVPVLGGSGDIIEAATTSRADVVILTIPSATRDEVARIILDALEHSAFSSDYLVNILEARRRPDIKPGALHVTRRSDLLDLTISSPDLEIYHKTVQHKEHF